MKKLVALISLLLAVSLFAGCQAEDDSGIVRRWNKLSVSIDSESYYVIDQEAALCGEFDSFVPGTLSAECSGKLTKETGSDFEGYFQLECPLYTLPSESSVMGLRFEDRDGWLLTVSHLENSVGGLESTDLKFWAYGLENPEEDGMFILITNDTGNYYAVKADSQEEAEKQYKKLYEEYGKGD